MFEEYRKRAAAFKKSAEQLLSKFEESPSRVIQLDQTYKNLGRLSVDQDELFRESLRCVELGLFRAGHVLAWAGFMDFLEEKLFTDGFKKLRSVRPNWHLTSVETLREQYPEQQLIEAAHEIGLLQKNEMKSILGLLSKRNECAHPSVYFPGLNETLGYISELIGRLDHLRVKPS